MADTKRIPKVGAIDTHEVSWFQGKQSVSRQEAERIIKQSKRDRDKTKELREGLCQGPAQSRR